jgi:hypothetical protein
VGDPAMLVSIFEGDQKSAKKTLDVPTLEKIADNVLVGDFILETNYQIFDGISPAEEYVVVKGFDVLFQLVAKDALRIIAFEDKGSSKVYFWDEKTRWYKTKDGYEYDNYWANDLLNAGINVVRPMMVLTGLDPKGRESLKAAYQNYDGTLIGFIGKLAKDGIVELVDDLANNNGSYRQSQALLGVWMGSSFVTPSIGLASTLSKNLLKFGVRLGGKTLTTWSFITILNVRIFTYSVENGQFMFSSALRTTANSAVVYSIRDIRYITDVDPTVKLGTIELVKDASGNIAWKELVETLEEVTLITSSNASKQARIDKIVAWLKAMGKNNSDINRIIRGKIDLSSGVSVIDLKKGDKIFRFERTVGIIEDEKHFFTTADAADAGVKSVGFADPTGYRLVTYEVLENTPVLKTKMNTSYTQFISDKLQNSIKVVSSEAAH